MTKEQVQEAAVARFASMNIPLANRYRKLVSAIVNKKIHSWLGFLRGDLLNLEKDAVALLCGHKVFTFQMQSLEFIVGKGEKGFEFYPLPTTAGSKSPARHYLLTTLVNFKQTLQRSVTQSQVL